MAKSSEDNESKDLLGLESEFKGTARTIGSPYLKIKSEERVRDRNQWWSACLRSASEEQGVWGGGEEFA